MTLTLSTCGFKYWKEKNGTRVLNASGLIENGWQLALTRKGTAFSANSLDPSVADSLGGRVQPPNVFLDYDNMVATNRWLYYDCGTQSQTLDAALYNVGAVEGEDWLHNWNSTATGRASGSSYYEGNIKTCADKGMRLPTMYETNVDIDACDAYVGCKSYLPTGDYITPTFAGTSAGVPGNPSNGSWTASAYLMSNYFWIWGDGTPGGNAPGGDFLVRCVLPNNVAPPPPNPTTTTTTVPSTTTTTTLAIGSNCNYNPPTPPDTLNFTLYLSGCYCGGYAIPSINFPLTGYGGSYSAGATFCSTYPDGSSGGLTFSVGPSCQPNGQMAFNVSATTDSGPEGTSGCNVSVHQTVYSSSYTYSSSQFSFNPF